MVSNTFTHKRNEERWACSKSWNYGVRDAFERGFDYVFIINNDVILNPLAIDKLVERFAKDDIFMATCMDVTGACLTPDHILTLPINEATPESEHPCFSGFMINRKCWETVGEFDEGFSPAYFEDNDYHYRINLSGGKAIVLPTSIFYHYGSRTVVEGLNDEAGRKQKASQHESFKNNEVYYKTKWGGLPGRETFKNPFGDESKDYKWVKQMS